MKNSHTLGIACNTGWEYEVLLGHGYWLMLPFFVRVISILPQCPEPERQLLLWSTVIHCKILQERQRPEFENLKEDTSYPEHLASFSRKSRCKPAKEQRSQVTLTCGLVIFSHSARRSCRSCWIDSLLNVFECFWMFLNALIFEHLWRSF